MQSSATEKMNNNPSVISLMKEDLKHRRWMLILSSIVQLFANPIVVLFAFSSVAASRSAYYADGKEDLTAYTVKVMKELVETMTTSYLPIMNLVIAVVGAVIVGIGGYRHLFNRRMTDMVNSLPVKREKQFAVIFINGLFIWLVPNIITLLLTTVFAEARLSAYGLTGIISKSCVFVTLGSLLCFFCIYALVILGCVLSGNIFNALLNMAFIGFDLIIGYSLMQLLFEDNFDNFLYLPVGFEKVLWTSQPISACVCGFVISYGKDALKELLESGVSVFTLIATPVVALINLGLSFFLYIRRKSEEAEAGVTNKPYRFVIRTLNAIYAGLIVSCILSELLYVRSGSIVIWRIFFAAFFTVLIYGIIDIMHGKSFKAFFAHWKQMIAVTVIMEMILAVFVFDLANYDNRIISENSIKSASIYCGQISRNSYASYFSPVPGKEGYLFSDYENDYDRQVEIDASLAYRIITARKWYTTDEAAYEYDPVSRKRIREWDWDDQPWGDIPDNYYIEINADRKAGFDFVRSYNITDEELVEDIIMSPGFREKEYLLESGAFGYPESMRIELRNGWGRSDIPDEFIPLIMEAYYADFKDNYSLEYLDQDSEGISLELRYRVYYSQESYEKDNYSTHSFYIRPISQDTRTMKVLEQLVEIGFIDRGDWESRMNTEDHDGDYYYDDYYPMYSF